MMELSHPWNLSSLAKLSWHAASCFFPYTFYWCIANKGDLIHFMQYNTKTRVYSGRKNLVLNQAKITC